MNFLLATPEAVQICSWFSEYPEYFQLRRTRDGATGIICSEPLPGEDLPWDRIPNRWLGAVRLAGFPGKPEQ